MSAQDFGGMNFRRFFKRLKSSHIGAQSRGQNASIPMPPEKPLQVIAPEFQLHALLIFCLESKWVSQSNSFVMSLQLMGGVVLRKLERPANCEQSAAGQAIASSFKSSEQTEEGECQMQRILTVLPGVAM